MQIGNIICKIKVDGTEATEYQEESKTDPKDGPIKTCYIISEHDKLFAFYVDPTDKENAGKTFSYNIYVDGEYQRGQVIQIKRSSTPKKLSQSSTKIRKTTIFERRDFKFSDLEIVEMDTVIGEGDIETRPKILQELGTLKVVFFPSQKKSSVPMKPPVTNPARPVTEVAKTKAIMEESLKGRNITQRSKLGAPSYKVKGYTRSKRTDANLATFIFKYASKESLQLRNIVPSSPGEEVEDEIPQVTETQNLTPLEDMSVEDLRAELRNRRREAEESAALDDGERFHKVKKEIKVEEQPGRRITGTIDLTEDDD